MTSLLIVTCRGPAGSLAIVDPVFAYLSPESMASFATTAREMTVLPESNLSASLYAVIDTKKPETVILSPLLASEITSILGRNDETRVAYLGPAPIQPHPRLYAALFSSVDAAEMAGRLAAVEASRLSGEGLVRVAAVFSGSSEQEKLSEAFSRSFSEEGGPGTPLVELAPAGFSQDSADRLRALDIRIAYIAASPRDTNRWIRQGFDQYSFVIAENPLPSRPTDSRPDAFVCWDIDATLDMLEKNLSDGMAGVSGGRWKTVMTGQTDGNRR